LPVRADAIATWGAHADAWFLAGGASSRVLHRLGNPRLDEAIRRDRVADRRGVGAGQRLVGRSHLLVALTPTSHAHNLRLVATTLDLLAIDANAVAIVKLHPGGGNWAPVRAAISKAPRDARTRLRVLRHVPLYPLLGWADLTLMHVSTVALESLAVGTPVALSGQGSRDPGDVALEELELPSADNGGDLARLLDSARAPAHREHFIAKRRDSLERFVGPLDGKASARIADFLMDARL